jgi:hypothetical protein
MKLRAGTRLRSSVCDTQVVVVRASDDDVELRCGGQPLVPLDATVTHQELSPDLGEGTAIGKRYADDDLGIELLCTKAGRGTLSVGDRVLVIKGAKPLPSSD